LKLLCISPFPIEAPTLYGRILPLLYELSGYGYDVHVAFPSQMHHTSSFKSHFQDRLKYIFLNKSPSPIKNRVYLPGYVKDVLRSLTYFQIGRFIPPIISIADLKILVDWTLSLKGNYDVIYTPKLWLRSAGASLWLSIRRSIPVFLDLDDYDVSIRNPYFKKFKGVIVASHELKKKLIHYSPCYIPNSANLNLFYRKKYQRISKRCVPTFVWSGFMYRFLKLELVLEAFSLMKEDANLIFIGDGEKKNKLEYLTNSFGLVEKIAFIGRINYTSLPEYLSKCDIGILPLSTSEYEKCKSPIKLYEYMAMQLPVIATSIGEAKYVVKEAKCGILVKPNDPIDMAKAMDYLARDEALREKMGQNGREFLEKRQNWKLLASRLHDFILNRIN